VNVRWTQYALDQFDLVVDNLVERRAPAGAPRVVDHVLQRVGALADLPWSAPAWRPAGDPSFRRLVAGDYVVLYRVVEDDGSVYVLAVRHGRERPLDPDDVPRS
jgi:plasmid stabilization system protein ParE